MFEILVEVAFIFKNPKKSLLFIFCLQEPDADFKVARWERVWSHVSRISGDKKLEILATFGYVSAQGTNQDSFESVRYLIPAKDEVERMCCRNFSTKFWQCMYQCEIRIEESSDSSCISELLLYNNVNKTNFVKEYLIRLKCKKNLIIDDFLISSAFHDIYLNLIVVLESIKVPRSRRKVIEKVNLIVTKEYYSAYMKYYTNTCQCKIWIGMIAVTELLYVNFCGTSM